MVKSINLDQSSLSYSNTIVGETSTAQNVILTNDGNELLTLSGITFGTDFEGKKSADPTYSSSIAGFTLATGDKKSTFIGQTVEARATSSIVDSNGDLIVVGTSAAIGTFNGETNPNPTKKLVWVIKYSSTGTDWTEDWTRVISDASYNFATYQTTQNNVNYCGVTLDTNDNIYISYGAVNYPDYDRIYISKIASDNGSISTITVDTTAGNFGMYFPVCFYEDNVFISYFDTNDSNYTKIKRYNTSLTLQETYRYKYSFGMRPRFFRVQNRNLVLTGDQYYGASSFSWGIEKYILDGSGNITESKRKYSTKGVNYGYDFSNDYFLIQNNLDQPLLVKDHDDIVLFGNVDVDWNIDNTAEFNGSTSKLFLPESTKFGFDDSEDFEFEIEFKLDSLVANAGLWGMNDGTHYTGLYYEALNQRMIFTDTKNSLSLSSNNSTITSTATSYKVKVTRVSNVGTIYIDSGSGYVDATNVSIGFSNSLTKYNAEFTIGFLDGPSPYYLDGRIKYYYHKKAGNTFINLYVTSSSQVNLVYVNTAYGFLKKFTSDITYTYFNFSNIIDDNDYVYVLGSIKGTWEAANPGDGGYYDYALCKINKSSGAIEWKKEFNGDVSNKDNELWSACIDIDNNLLYACGYSNGNIFGSSYGGGSYKNPNFFSFRSEDGSVDYANGTPQTINIRFAPVTSGSKSQSATVSSDATSSPDTVTLSGLALDRYRFLEHIDDHATAAKDRIISQYK